MKHFNFLLVLLLPFLATACGTVTREEAHFVMSSDDPRSIVTLDQKTERIDRRSHHQEEEDRCPPLPVLREGATIFESRLHRQVVIALYKQCAESKK